MYNFLRHVLCYLTGSFLIAHMEVRLSLLYYGLLILAMAQMAYLLIYIFSIRVKIFIGMEYTCFG